MIRGRFAWRACLLVALSLSAACTEGSTDTPRSEATEPPNSALLGSPDAAAGELVRIGFISDGEGTASDASGELESAAAAVDYVNGYLGGVASGRPIELVTCETGVTPAGATDCANQMVAANVPLVVGVAPGIPGPIVTVLDDAEIPYFVYATVESSVLASQNSYVLTNTLGGLATPIKVAQDNDVAKVATLLIDLPAARGPVQAIGEPLFEAAGIEAEYLAIAPGTPDMTPEVRSAIDNGAEMFSIIGDPTFCISALGALETLEFPGIRLVNPQCLSEDVAPTLSNGLDGVMVGTVESLDPNDAEVATYEAVLSTFAPDLDPHESTNSGGYAIVLATARALHALSGEVTPEAVHAAFATMDSQPMPLMEGQTFKCDRSLFSLAPPICSSGIVVATLDSAGDVTTEEPFDTEPILNG